MMLLVYSFTCFFNDVASYIEGKYGHVGKGDWAYNGRKCPSKRPNTSRWSSGYVTWPQWDDIYIEPRLN